eukprot:283686-Rhodomonas_salina.3
MGGAYEKKKSHRMQASLSVPSTLASLAADLPSSRFPVGKATREQRQSQQTRKKRCCKKLACITGRKRER